MLNKKNCITFQSQNRICFNTERSRRFAMGTERLLAAAVVLTLLLHGFVQAAEDTEVEHPQEVEYDCEKTPKSITNCTKDHPYCYNSTLSTYRPCWEICPDKSANSSESKCGELCATYLREKCREILKNFPSTEMAANATQSCNSHSNSHSNNHSNNHNNNRSEQFVRNNIIIGTSISAAVVIVLVILLLCYLWNRSKGHTDHPPTVSLRSRSGTDHTLTVNPRGVTIYDPSISRWSKIKDRISRHHLTSFRALPPTGDEDKDGNLSVDKMVEVENLQVINENDSDEFPIDIIVEELVVPVQASQPPQ